MNQQTVINALKERSQTVDARDSSKIDKNLESCFSAGELGACDHLDESDWYPEQSGNATLMAYPR